ncbi:hypothetical protein EXIGLDRAFT_846546 [Exidia glandulosa HHB12029]|uniref:Uncharacterized protein n=1 Tax=Exidia glandulosa HHB12029 TaxID=1314781 RepID=A0A165AUZ9_EXIGL|nr:hypothetical protein EXIGLDRAFT_846546 [Exidia glandulosa HHB12029]
MMVGTELDGMNDNDWSRYCRWPTFSESTRDLTDDPAYASLIGFSYQDVVDLGHAVIGDGPGFGREVLGRCDPTILAGDLGRAVFSASAVVSILSARLNGALPTVQNPHASVPYVLPPLPSVDEPLVLSFGFPSLHPSAFNTIPEWQPSYDLSL